MTESEILAIAAECGNDNDSTLPSDLEFLTTFARRIAAMQKEKDAEICDALDDKVMDEIQVTDHIVEQEFASPFHCAAAIRSQSDE